ncbi:hypothetical protein EMIT0158MI4_320002 [Burkholderia ambifaria]
MKHLQSCRSISVAPARGGGYFSLSCQRKVTKRKALRQRMTSRCHSQRSGPRLSVGASWEPGVVRASGLTPLTTPQSGIPPASSVLASLGR